MYSSPTASKSFSLTFRGFLMVRLMEFDYAGKHYSYHGRKLENALNRLPFDGQFHKHSKRTPTVEELVVWGQAVYDWKRIGRGEKL